MSKDTGVSLINYHWIHQRERSLSSRFSGYKQPERRSADIELQQEARLPETLSLSNLDALIKQPEDSQQLIQKRQAEVDALIQSQQKRD